MQPIEPITLEVYCDAKGKQPFVEWLQKLRDRQTRARIERRLERLEQGNRGDCKGLGEGLFELRLFFGSGYRVDYGERDRQLIVLLCGGDKDSQERDITNAQTLWRDYLRRTTQ